MAYSFNPFTGNLEFAGVPDPLVVDNLTVNTLLEAAHIHGSIAGNVYVHVRNDSNTTLAEGTPVYVVGSVGDTDRVRVAACDPTDPAKMPAIGLLETSLTHNQDGNAIILGELRQFDTEDLTLNQILYVGAGGTLTGTQPGSGIIQAVGMVARVQQNTGTIVVHIGDRLRSGAFADEPGLVTSSTAGLIPAPPEGEPTGKVFTDALEWAEQTGGGGPSPASDLYLASQFI